MTTTENEQRDELAQELFIADNSNQPREASIVDWEWFEGTGKQRSQVEHYKNMAAGMIAAGYHKPRTITTVEELDALPDGSVVRSKFGELLERTDGCWYFGEVGGTNDPALPATVLWEPEAEATQ